MSTRENIRLIARAPLLVKHILCMQAKEGSGESALFLYFWLSLRCSTIQEVLKSHMHGYNCW